MALTSNEGTKKGGELPVNTGVSEENTVYQKNYGEEYRNVINSKANAIIPILDGLTLTQIEDILKEIKDNISRYPILIS